ncbi:MAG: tetratricopeptide repeat protein [Candidatus Methylomirabilales bacterium]
MRRWRLPVRDRVLLHLFDYIRFRDSFESPFEITQAGIAGAVGIRPGHATQYLKPLLSERMVEDETRHILGKPRRRKAYFLTAKGRQWVASERAALLKETVPLKRRDGQVEQIPLQDVYHERRRGASLLSLIRELSSLGFISDVTSSAESGLVDLSQEAPTVKHFYGREVEMGTILDTLEETPLVVIRGMAGVGKTALGSKICERLRGERSLYWRRIRSWDTAFDLASRVGVFLEALGRSDLHRYLSESRQRSLSRVEDLLAADLAGLRTLIVFDDVHVASEDAESFLALLLNALRKVRGSSVLLLSRTTPDFYSRRAVELEGNVFETVLRPLDRGSGEALLADAGVPQDQRERLFDLSGGNPLFMRLLAETGVPSGVWDGWETLHAYISEEIAPQLAEEERRCLQVASLFEIPVPPEGLLLEHRGDLGTVLGLQRKGLLDEVKGGKVALHDALREYFRRGLPQERKEVLIDRVVLWLLREADKAEEARQWETALAFLGNALLLDGEASRRGRSLEKIGDLRREVGDSTGAVEAFQQALDLTSEKDIQGRLHRKAAHCQVLLLRPEDAQRRVEAGLQILGMEPSIEAAWLLSIRALARFHDLQDYAGAMRDVETALSWLPSLREDLALRAMLESQKGTLHYLDPEQYDPRAVQEHFEACLSCFEALEDLAGISAARRILAFALLDRGDLEGATSQLEKAAVLAEEVGDYLTLISSAWFLAECLGDYDRAEELYRQGFELLKNADIPEHLVWYNRLLSDLYRRTGRYEEAREILAYFLETSEGMVNMYRRVENLALMARVCLLCGDVEQPERYVHEAERQRRETESKWLDLHVAWAGGLLQAAKGDVSRADALLRQIQKPGIPEARRGVMFEILSTLFTWGEFLLDWGKALAVGGMSDRAAEVLREAREELRRAGRKPLEQEATEALRALGLVALQG